MRGPEQSIAPTEKKQEQPTDDDEVDPAIGYLHGYKLVATIAALMTVVSLYGLDQSIVATCLVAIGDDFGEFSKIQWIATAYLLSTTALCCSWGKVAYIFGRKRTFMSGIVLFEIGSLICGVSTSMDMLIGGRTIAGVGGGCIQTLVFIIISEILLLEKRTVSSHRWCCNWSFFSYRPVDRWSFCNACHLALVFLSESSNRWDSLPGHICVLQAFAEQAAKVGGKACYDGLYWNHPTHKWNRTSPIGFKLGGE